MTEPSGKRSKKKSKTPSIEAEALMEGIFFVVSG
jgi:hypothetical protein